MANDGARATHTEERTTGHTALFWSATSAVASFRIKPNRPVTKIYNISIMYIYIYMERCTYMCMYIHRYVHTCMHLCMYIYTHELLYIYAMPYIYIIHACM